VYSKEKSKNFKVNAFLDYAWSNEHVKLSWAFISGGETMEKAILNNQHACDEALRQTLFQAALYREALSPLFQIVQIIVVSENSYHI